MKLMIVDDSSLLQFRLKKAIKKINRSIEVFQAFNCREALEQFTCHSPDTIIIDLALPDGSGIDLLKKFRTEDLKASLFILTNFSDIKYKRQCIGLGANMFFDKAHVNSLLEHLSKQSLINKKTYKNR